MSSVSWWGTNMFNRITTSWCCYFHRIVNNEKKYVFGIRACKDLVTISFYSWSFSNFLNRGMTQKILDYLVICEIIVFFHRNLIRIDSEKRIFNCVFHLIRAIHVFSTSRDMIKDVKSPERQRLFTYADIFFSCIFLYSFWIVCSILFFVHLRIQPFFFLFRVKIFLE